MLPNSFKYKLFCKNLGNLFVKQIQVWVSEWQMLLLPFQKCLHVKAFFVPCGKCSFWSQQQQHWQQRIRKSIFYDQSERERGKCNFANYESRIFSGLWLNNFFTTTKVTLVVGATNKFNCIWVLHFVFFLPTLDPKYLFVSRLAANMLRPATGAVHCSKNTKISNSVQQLIPLRHVTSVNEALM